jgi:hypothetical protein
VLIQQVGGNHFDPVEKMFDPFVAVVAGAPYHTYHFISLGQEEFREV